MKLTFDVPEEMAERIAEDIKVALEEYKKKQIWPQVDDEYYLILADGRITCDRYDGNPTDKNRFRLGNMFKTQEEAEFKLEQLKVMHELEQLADDDQPWSQKYTHWDIYFDRIASNVFPDYHSNNKYTQYMFNSKESAQAAIDKIGKDRLKKYYFGVKDVV